MADKAMFADTKENLVLAKGRVLGIGRDDYSHKRIILFVRGSKDKNPAYVSFAINADLPLDIAVNDTVDVEGHYVSYAPKADSFRSIKRRPIQYFVADKITKSVTELEKVFGVPGFAHEPSFCRAYFKGMIRDITQSTGSNWMNVRVQIPGEPGNHHKNIALVQYTTKMRASDIDVQAGDTVCMACFVTSKKKVKNDKEYFFEDFIVEDWAILERGSAEEKKPEKKAEKAPKLVKVEEPAEEEKDALLVGA